MRSQTRIPGSAILGTHVVAVDLSLEGFSILVWLVVIMLEARLGSLPCGRRLDPSPAGGCPGGVPDQLHQRTANGLDCIRDGLEGPPPGGPSFCGSQTPGACL